VTRSAHVSVYQGDAASTLGVLPSASVDVVALIHVHGLEQAGHGCAQMHSRAW